MPSDAAQKIADRNARVHADAICAELDRMADFGEIDHFTIDGEPRDASGQPTTWPDDPAVAARIAADALLRETTAERDALDAGWSAGPLWRCGVCGFGYAAEHFTDELEDPCPVCAEHRLHAERDALRACLDYAIAQSEAGLIGWEQSGEFQDLWNATLPPSSRPEG